MQMRTANVTVTMEAEKVRDRAEALLAAAKERVYSLERSIEVHPGPFHPVFALSPTVIFITLTPFRLLPNTITQSLFRR